MNKINIVEIDEDIIKAIEQRKNDIIIVDQFCKKHDIKTVDDMNELFRFMHAFQKLYAENAINGLNIKKTWNDI